MKTNFSKRHLLENKMNDVIARIGVKEIKKLMKS